MVEYCDYFMPQRKFPDKAIDVLDLSCVYAKRKKQNRVDDAIVRSVIEQLTDIPLVSRNRLAFVKARLQERIVGQARIIDQLMEQLTWIEQGVVSNRPLGVWLFCGSHCCGKKTMMKEFTRAYFNQEDMIELDVSIIDQVLANVMTKIKRNPYTTIYVSNLHVATPQALQFLRQAITKGFLELQNQKVDLRHAIFIMSGDFPLSSQSTMRLYEQASHQTQLEKLLGKEFIEVFDEIFVFEALSDLEKMNVLKQKTSIWRQVPLENEIQEALQDATSLDEAFKKLRLGVTHSN